jgi:hypothetical protein
MKKISLILFTLCFAVQASAQDTAATAPSNTYSPPPQSQKVRLGLSFSPVLSWFSASGDAGTVEPDGMRFNIAFGLNTDFRIGQNSNYYLSTGLFLLNTGGTITHQYFTETAGGDFFLSERTADFRINYVNVPFTVMLRTNEIGYMRYFGRVGFDAAFNTNSTFDYEDFIEDQEQTISVEDEDASDFTALFRAGLHIEAGFEYNIGGTTSIYFSATYNNGLNNVFSDDYRLPTGATEDGSDRLAIDPDTGEPFVERRVKASTNLFMVTVGAYF